MKTNPGNYFEDFRLGQEIVQAVAKAHGAKVALASAAGAGATFRVTLPD